jgi:hypothetical protein
MPSDLVAKVVVRAVSHNIEEESRLDQDIRSAVVELWRRRQQQQQQQLYRDVSSIAEDSTGK